MMQMKKKEKIAKRDKFERYLVIITDTNFYTEKKKDQQKII